MDRVFQFCFVCSVFWDHAFWISNFGFYCWTVSRAPAPFTLYARASARRGGGTHSPEQEPGICAAYSLRHQRCIFYCCVSYPVFGDKNVLTAGHSYLALYPERIPHSCCQGVPSGRAVVCAKLVSLYIFCEVVFYFEFGAYFPSLIFSVSVSCSSC